MRKRQEGIELIGLKVAGIDLAFKAQRQWLEAAEGVAFKQQQPLAQQAIMESKQKQMSGAADAFLKEAMAMATQQDAASRFGSLGTGRRFG